MMKKYILLISLYIFSFSSYADIAVIVNKNHPVNLTNKQIKNIFLGKMNFYPDGKQALPIVQNGNQQFWQDYTNKILKKTPESARIYWAKKLFSGKAKPPKKYETSQEIILKVKSDLKFIGIIDSSDKTDDVRILIEY